MPLGFAAWLCETGETDSRGGSFEDVSCHPVGWFLCYFFLFFISDCNESILLAGWSTDLVRGTKTEKGKREKISLVSALAIFIMLSRPTEVEEIFES